MQTIEQIAEFLRDHPDFFEHHVDVLLNLQVAHPHGGRTVSIPERQLIATREKVQMLENKLAELVQFGEENDTLSEKTQRLMLRLIDCNTLDALIDTLYLELHDTFNIPHAAVRFWAVAATELRMPEFAEVSPEMRQFVEAMTSPYCGAHPVFESNTWFGEHAPHLKSYALIPLKKEACFGALVLASENAQRFYAEMGTVFLSRIGEIFAACGKRHWMPPLHDTSR